MSALILSFSNTLYKAFKGLSVVLVMLGLIHPPGASNADEQIEKGKNIYNIMRCVSHATTWVKVKGQVLT